MNPAVESAAARCVMYFAGFFREATAGKFIAAVNEMEWCRHAQIDLGYHMNERRESRTGRLRHEPEFAEKVEAEILRLVAAGVARRHDLIAEFSAPISSSALDVALQRLQKSGRIRLTGARRGPFARWVLASTENLSA